MLRYAIVTLNIWNDLNLKKAKHKQNKHKTL